VELSYIKPCEYNGKPCRKKLLVNGDNNLVFIGNFPKLKMCEGSGNADSGQADCCVKFSTQTELKSCQATRRALKDFNEECPSGTFNVRNTCEDLNQWCDDIHGAINGCMDCLACPDLSTCPACAPNERKN